jgi:hypothetical protein
LGLWSRGRRSRRLSGSGLRNLLAVSQTQGGQGKQSQENERAAAARVRCRCHGKLKETLRNYQNIPGEQGHVFVRLSVPNEVIEVYGDGGASAALLANDVGLALRGI